MVLTIETWNMRGAAAMPWCSKREISPAAVDKLMEHGAHILVLTEFCVLPGWEYFQEQLKKENYVWFMGSVTGKNGVLICIKSTLVQSTLGNDVYKRNLVSYHPGDCNLLRVSFSLPLKDSAPKTVTVIGYRMEVETDGKATKDGKELYDSRRAVFDKVLIPAVKEHLPGSDIFIVCGDFNNAYCRGDLTKKYCRADYAEPEELDQINYNLNIIKDTFDDLGFHMADQKGKRGIPTWRHIPEDHIFVKGLLPVPDGCKPVEMDGFSDHRLVSAEVLLPDGEA